jgi:tyrosine ammonia-lyase
MSMPTAQASSSLPATHLAQAQGVATAKRRRAADGHVLVGREICLTCDTVSRFAATQSHLGFTPQAERAMRQSAHWLHAAQQRGEPIYGLTTGFGPHVKYCASPNAVTQGAGLIAHLAAGWGRPAGVDIIRATALLRAHTLGLGFSGIDPAAARTLAELVNQQVYPVIPEIGSVGASGDLIPLSHLARVLMGDGWVLGHGGATCPAGPILAAKGITPVQLTGRDALALVNGTAFMSAYAALAVARAQRLVERAEAITGWLYRLLGARSQALDPRLHAVRGHEGQMLSAAEIAREAGRVGPWEDLSRPLQEVYSIRCAPQILGACRENLAYARRIVEIEINGVNDNPVVHDGEPGGVIHGGNFQGQQIAFAADAVNAALVQAAVLAERQLDVLCNPELSGGTLLLAWEPGATSGFAGAQITATALIAEMRMHGGPAATSSIPTNGRNQDVVSMGTMAARLALEQTARFAAVLAVTSMAAEQLSFLRENGRAHGKPVSKPDWMPAFTPLTEDRTLRDDISRIGDTWLAA